MVYSKEQRKIYNDKYYAKKKQGLLSRKYDKNLGTAANVCLNPKFFASCLKTRVYRCKDICNLVNNSKYENYINKYKESIYGI